MEDLHRELLRRAQEAVEQAEKEHRRASEMQAFIGALRATEPGELVRCAWCGRVAAGDQWLDPTSLLGGNLRERLRWNASHSICPDCFERVSAEVDHQRR
jgi:hypothetical protein